MTQIVLYINIWHYDLPNTIFQNHGELILCTSFTLSPFRIRLLDSDALGSHFTLIRIRFCVGSLRSGISLSMDMCPQFSLHSVENMYWFHWLLVCWILIRVNQFSCLKYLYFLSFYFLCYIILNIHMRFWDIVEYGVSLYTLRIFTRKGAPAPLKPMNIYTFEELNLHACGFILSKCYPFTDLENALRAVSNLKLCKMGRFA